MAGGERAALRHHLTLTLTLTPTLTLTLTPTLTLTLTPPLTLTLTPTLTLTLTRCCSSGGRRSSHGCTCGSWPCSR